MPKPVYKFEVDWDHDDTYGHAQVDITADVPIVRPWSWGAGRSGNSSLSSKSQAGKLVLPLMNRTGKFSSFNTSSPIYGLIKPGRRVRVYMGPTNGVPDQLVWSGRLDNILPAASVSSHPSATLTAFGVLATVAAGRARVERKTTILVSDAVDDVLDSIGFPAGARDINTSQSTMSAWIVKESGKGNALRELFALEDTEFGWIRESKDDEVVFEDRHYRFSGARLTSQKTYADDGTGGAILYQSIPQTDPVKDVYNRITARVPNDGLASLSTLWQTLFVGSDSALIAPGETQIFRAEYPSPTAAVQDVGAVWTTPVATTDYTANTQSDDGGIDLVASIGVSVTKSLDLMTIAMTNNHATLSAYITKNQARGQAVREADVQEVEAFDQDSIDSYGDREWPNKAKYLGTLQEAIDSCRYILSLQKDVSPRMNVSFLASADSAHLTEAYTRFLSDRVTVESHTATQLGLVSEEMFVERIQHHVVNGGAPHRVTLTLSSASAVAKIIVLDTGPGLDTGVLGY